LRNQAVRPQRMALISNLDWRLADHEGLRQPEFSTKEKSLHFFKGPGKRASASV
jgi:hypothetical protein